ncbi:MAG: hypothetical protein ACR2MM_08185, partial [Flavobacteriaceae bacterium]
AMNCSCSEKRNQKSPVFTSRGFYVLNYMFEKIKTRASLTSVIFRFFVILATLLFEPFFLNFF